MLSYTQALEEKLGARRT